jgi:hypothetical protein
MKLTKKQNFVLECLISYIGVTDSETLYNHIETILNDVYIGHLDILQEDFDISKDDIISVQSKLEW